MTGPGPTDRRDLLRNAVGKWIERAVDATEARVAPHRYHRPPGALPEVGFLAACTRCGECLPVCPAKAIIRVPTEGGLAAGTPAIEPAVQPCIVCTDMPCVAACPTGALAPPAHGWRGLKLGRLELVPERCVTFSGTACGVCAEACPIGPDALTMDAGGKPVLKAEGCVGCGLCVRSCITAPSSLVLHPLQTR
jgi:MauM/NapG family ferredoxin protein